MVRTQKELWNWLARQNTKYVIYTSKGMKITEKEFVKSGWDDYTKHILNDTRILEASSILDLGCGIGRLTEYMAEDFKRVVGVGVSGEMIRQAKERMEGLDNVELIENNGDLIPLKDNSIDAVFSFLVFQHIKTREMTEKNFKEVYRVLKPGGLFKVLLGTAKNQKKHAWWSGVDYDEDSAKELSKDFKLLRKEKEGKNGLWLWLEK